MNAITDFPPIEAPVATLAPASIKSAVLAQFADAERTVTALADKYRRVAYDCTTTAGMTAAKAARMDLRENGRYAVQRAESRVKADVNDLKRVMADEVERIVGIVRPVEDAIDQQIKAREEQVAAEKAERERKAAEDARIEAERQQRHEDGIATLAGYVGKAKGWSAERMANGIAFVEKITIDPAHWQEYAERAAKTLAETLEALRTMHAAQVKAEADEAELVALRAEKAAREQREREAAEAAARVESERLERLADENRQALAREHAALEAERFAELEAGAPKPQDAELALAEAPLQQDTMTLPAGAGTITAVAPDSEMTAAWPLPKAEPAAAPAAPDPQVNLINLGEFSRRLEFTVSAAMLATFGIEPTTTHKASKLYHPGAWPRLCDALVAHIQAKRGAY